MSKEDVMVSVGIDLDSLKKSLASAQSAMAQAFGASGKSAGAFGVTINNVTKTTVSNTEATRAQVNALKVQQAQHNATAAAAKAQTAQINSQTAALRNQMAVNRAANAQSGGSSGRGRGAPMPSSLRQSGNVAMQIQDIAVTAQAGMSLSQIIGQQGSQLLSIFGPAGALAGGVAAVGAAFYTYFSNASKAADELNLEGEKLLRTFSKVVAVGDSMDIAKAMDANADAMRELGRVASSHNDDFFFSLSDQKEVAAALENQGKLYWANVYAIDALNHSAELSAKLSKARADGDEAGARALERYLSLRKNLAEIDAMQVPEPVKERLRKGASLEQEAQINAEEKKRKETSEELIAQSRAEVEIAEEKLKGGDLAGELKKIELDLAKKLAEIEKRTDISQSAKSKLSENAIRLSQSEKDLALKESAAEIVADLEKDEKKIADRREKAIRDQQNFNDKQKDQFGKDQKQKERDSKKATKSIIEQRDKLRVLDAELGGNKRVADTLERRLKFEREITEAQEKGNFQLAALLEKEKQMLDFKEAIDEQLKSPEQKKKERDEQKEREKAGRIVRSRERRKAQAAQQIGFGGFVDDKGKPAKAVPNLQPNAPAGGAAGGVAGNAMKVDTLVVKVLKHG